MTGPFFNTVHLMGAELTSAIAQAKRQDDAVLAIFVTAAGPMPPSQVHRLCTQAGRTWPPTSVRRAITNLTKRDLLAKTDTLVRGPLGKPEHLWTVK